MKNRQMSRSNFLQTVLEDTQLSILFSVHLLYLNRRSEIISIIKSFFRANYDFLNKKTFHCSPNFVRCTKPVSLIFVHFLKCVNRFKKSLMRTHPMHFRFMFQIINILLLGCIELLATFMPNDSSSWLANGLGAVNSFAGRCKELGDVRFLRQLRYSNLQSVHRFWGKLDTITTRFSMVARILLYAKIGGISRLLYDHLRLSIMLLPLRFITSWMGFYYISCHFWISRWADLTDVWLYMIHQGKTYSFLLSFNPQFLLVCVAILDPACCI